MWHNQASGEVALIDKRDRNKILWRSPGDAREIVKFGKGQYAYAKDPSHSPETVTHEGTVDESKTGGANPTNEYDFSKHDKAELVSFAVAAELDPEEIKKATKVQLVEMLGQTGFDPRKLAGPSDEDD